MQSLSYEIAACCRISLTTAMKNVYDGPMHELGATQSILQVVLDTAKKNKAKKIKRVDLVIGQLSGYVEESIEFIFQTIRKGTPAEKAELRFKKIMALSHCTDCGNDFEQTLPLLPECPCCGGMNLQISGGDEFYIESIEVEDEDSGYKGNI